jgi:hypothetical protein
MAKKKDLACSQCGKVPQRIISWKRKWYCPDCDEVRRRNEILAQGIIIDDEGFGCEGCLFGIREVDLCVVDPDGDGPYHRECAIACGHDPKNVRIAPDEIVGIDLEEFQKLGSRVYKQ